jgi:hypothetical protein
MEMNTTKAMIEIDGSQGEGGGQIIRSSLALAAVTGRAIKLTKIRAGRKKSGLMRQHLTAVIVSENGRSRRRILGRPIDDANGTCCQSGPA